MAVGATPEEGHDREGCGGLQGDDAECAKADHGGGEPNVRTQPSNCEGGHDKQVERALGKAGPMR